MAVPIDTFSNRLKKALEIKNIKSAELVKLTGLSSGAICNYLAGRYEPKQNILSKLALALNVNETWLMGYDVHINRQVPLENNGKPTAIVVPIYAVIPAGIPLEMIEDITGYEEIPINMCNGNKQYFGLKVKGLSMYPKYYDSDIIIVLAQNDCESGDDCVVSIGNDNATLKKVIKLKDGIMLQPINPEFTPIIYSNKEIKLLPVKVLGVVKELRRKL